MSVTEFYADEWQSQAVGLAMGLKSRSDKLSNLGQGLQGLTTSRQIYGQGADSMKAYISEVHLSLIQSLLSAVQTFQTATGVYYNGYQDIDSSGDFRLIREDLQGHVRQLKRGISQMSRFQSRIQRITRSVDDIVYLGSAGSRGLNYVKIDFEEMLRLVTTQLREWEAYENSNAGFDKVETLVGELKNMLSHIGQLTVGSGRGYQSGSFNQSLQVLSGLVTDISDYNQKNAKVASAAWQDMVDDYIKDVKKIEEAKAKSKGVWGLIWDGIQIFTGAVITVVGLGLTPLTGGFSLGLTALGGSLLVGGINSAIKDGSQAVTGKGVSLIGMASDGIGSWYSKHIAQPAIDSGDPRLAFWAGAVGAAGNLVEGTLSFNAYETGKGMWSLVSDPSARKAFGQGISHWWQQVSRGDAYTLGETAFNVASFVGPMAASKLGKASESGSLLSKFSTIKTSSLSNVKNFSRTFMSEYSKGGVRSSFLGSGEVGKIGGALRKTVGKKVGGFKPEKIKLKGGEIAYKSQDGMLVRSADYLDEAGNINWPKHNGFLLDEAGNPIMKNANIKNGQILDRYGAPDGTFTSPLENGKILNYDSRGLPYPESVMDYHQYEVIKDLNLKNVQQGFDNLSLVDQQKLKQLMSDYSFNLKDMAQPKSGMISEVFGSGGGIQIRLGTSVSWYEKLGILKEIK